MIDLYEFKKENDINKAIKIEIFYRKSKVVSICYSIGSVERSLASFCLASAHLKRFLMCFKAFMGLLGLKENIRFTSMGLSSLRKAKASRSDLSKSLSQISENSQFIHLR